jgi:hypothetical protein
MGQSDQSPGMLEGVKHDQGKVPLDLLPFGALEEVAKVMGHGADKYGRYNYANGMNWSRCLGAALRHIFSWAKGDSIDPETGLNHLSHATCNLLFLLTYQQHNLGKDDRGNYETPKGT